MPILTTYPHNRISFNKSSYWKVLFFSLLIWLIDIQFCHALPPKNLAPILAKLNAHIQNHVQEKQIAGCAVAIVYQNKIVFMNAYGVKTIGKKDKIDLDTVFQLGSVSKPIAATLTSILENKGLLRLDDPVKHYLPNFSLKSRQSIQVLKIRHILSHSTGVPRAGFNNLIESLTPYQHILKSLQNTPVRTPIGRRYDYHNAMFSIIGDITQAAARAPFRNVLYTNLLQPLNMTQTSTTLQGLLRSPNRASPHARTRRGLVPCGRYSNGYYNVAAAGGMNSSIRDMAVFLKAQLGGYPQIINHRMLARIQTPQIKTNSNVLSPYEGPANLIKNARYALGWRVVDFAHHKLVFHGGWVQGFTNFIAFMPDHDVGIVVLHNSESKFSSKTAVKFFELFLDIPPQKKKPQKIVKKVKRIKRIQYQAYSR